MIPHEIRPKQLRALLLLLVLVPLIPTAFMLRFMFDALRAERTAAMERQGAIYRPTLSAAAASWQRHSADVAEEATPQRAHEFLRERLDEAVLVRIVDAAGQVLAGEARPGGALVAQTAPGEWSLPWQVQLHLRSDAGIEASLREQWRLYAWIGGAAILAIGAIAGVAGLAVSRQLRLHELKSTAVATVAHELRTPLASMRMLVDTLRDGRCREEGQRREYLDLIARENERLSRLTESFLTLSRLEHGRQGMKIAAVEIRPLLEEVLSPLRGRLAAPGCHFTCEAPESLPGVAADRDALHAILTNLLDNALKYTGERKRIALRASQDGGCVLFAVSDDGVGLTREERREVFAPFHQVDRKLTRAQGGCGLGLSIVQRLVAQLGGKIRVEAEAGRGSTFTVELPAAA